MLWVIWVRGSYTLEIQIGGGGGESKKFGNPGGRFFIIINIMNSIIFKYINNLKIAYVI